jgi:hypothetical protein
LDLLDRDLRVELVVGPGDGEVQVLREARGQRRHLRHQQRADRDHEPDQRGEHDQHRHAGGGTPAPPATSQPVHGRLEGERQELRQQQQADQVTQAAEQPPGEEEPGDREGGQHERPG